jgi:hypothetical protein
LAILLQRNSGLGDFPPKCAARLGGVPPKRCDQADRANKRSRSRRIVVIYRGNHEIRGGLVPI